MLAISTREAAVTTGPSTGESTRRKMNDPPQIAASATRRAVSAARIDCTFVLARVASVLDAESGRSGHGNGANRHERPLRPPLALDGRSRRRLPSEELVEYLVHLLEVSPVV